MVTNMSIGQRIRAQRINSGLSQEKVAELVGVSRQAVTKWETGRSAPSSENLFRLAALFGTTVDFLLAPEEAEKNITAEQMYRLYMQDQADRANERKVRRKKNIMLALVVCAGYIMIYLLCRIGGGPEQSSVMGWLFSSDMNRFSYLYGWLVKQNLFWVSMAVSIIPAFFGKYRFSFTTFSGFGAGLLFGELFGENPAGAPYGQSHYGWAIWGGIFLFSIVMGVIAERIKGLAQKSRKWWIWGAVSLAGVIAVILLVRFGIPQTSGN